MAMASPAAAASRARRLFSIFSPTTPRAQAPKLALAPAPAVAAAPDQNAAAGEAEAKPKAGRNRRKRLAEILRVISEERNPDKMVFQFIAASAASPRFRDNHRVYKVAVSRLTSFGRQDAVAALLDSQKPFLESSNEDFAVRLVRLYGYASMPSHATATFLDLPPKHKSVTAFNALLATYVDSANFEMLVAAFQVIPSLHYTAIQVNNRTAYSSSAYCAGTRPLDRPRCHPAHGEVRPYPRCDHFQQSA
jgi:hypothetical protein